MKTKSRQSSFMTGFWQGMAEPLMLFDPPASQQMRDQTLLEMPTSTDTEALRSDWEKIGGDMRRVIDREKEKWRESGLWSE